jgi:hypothetical protein
LSFHSEELSNYIKNGPTAPERENTNKEKNRERKRERERERDN